MSERVRVRVTGLVQGVGFRYATYREAQRLGLCGWVRNVPDGAVEALFEGDGAILDAMLAWCERGPALARVDSLTIDRSEAEGSFSGFEIAF